MHHVNSIDTRQIRKKKLTYIVFGWVPSLLHVHHVNIKNRPEMHFEGLQQKQACVKVYRDGCSPVKQHW